MAILLTKAIFTVALKGVKESDKQQKESPPAESRSSEQTPLRSKLSSRAVWAQLDVLLVPDLVSGLCLNG